jgi:CheY-like chemotaxis protein
VGLAALALAAAWFPARTVVLAPEGWMLPRKKLDELKKQLPTVLQDEALAKWLQGAKVRLVRLVGPAEAKVRVLVPGLDGYGVARELRLNPTTARTRLLALTGYGQDEDKRRSREAGFDYHLVKPADPEELRRLLASG